MKRFLWMHAWDLEARDSGELLDELEAASISEVRLALAYHGGRMLLPRNRRYLVYEQHDGAVYFRPTLNEYGGLAPAPGPHLDAVDVFLRTAAARRFPVRAWLVLCHNDHLGRRHPSLCIRNHRGDRYTYALCPAQPQVEQYILALVRDASALPGIVGLDLEALSFFGYEHNSLHDKRAVTPDPAIEVCHCDICNGTQDRPAILPSMLDRIRAATPLLIDLRYTDDPLFYGGKTWLPPELLPGRIDSVTRTYFGKPCTPRPISPSRPTRVSSFTRRIRQAPPSSPRASRDAAAPKPSVSIATDSPAKSTGPGSAPFETKHLGSKQNFCVTAK